MMPKDLATATLSVTLGQHSAAGRKPVNQDFHGAIIPEGRALTLKGAALAISDGISSSEVSQIASETAVKSFLSDYYCTSDAWSVKTAASRVIAATNSWLHAQNTALEDLNRGHVATFTALILKGRTAHVFHIGDARVWRVSGGTLEQLTTDHRVVLSSVENYLGRALGLSPAVEIDYRAIPLEPGATFVLTTDGVHEHLTPQAIAATIAERGPEAAAAALAEAALANGSEDNLTIQILRVDTLPPKDAAGILTDAGSLPPATIPRLPFELDLYRVERPIHRSHRSHIYYATDLETGDPVALKIPSADMKDDEAAFRRFAMEEWIARRLNSPHVLKPAPAHEDRSALYVVTEYLEGRTLRQWMTDNPSPDLETVRDLIDQIARGLQAFHRKDMLHQDLRPENIMIDRNGTVKIIDFGAVEVAGILEAAPALDKAEILGTHQYAAPEYFLGYKGSTGSDIFSLGVIAYELLTGRLPYGATVARATSEKAQSALRYVGATTLDEKIPFWVDEALRRAVHPDPAKRYGELSEFTTDLRKPNPVYDRSGFVPLAQRDPVRFWQTVSGLLALIVVALTLHILGQ